MTLLQRLYAEVREHLYAAGLVIKMVDPKHIEMQKMLFYHCVHGLCLRLRALGSCIVYTESTKREFIALLGK